MLVKLHFYLLLPLLVISCTSTPLPKGGSVSIPYDFLGIGHAGKKQTAEEYQLLDEMNVYWILDTFYWRIIEPEMGRFDF